MARRSPQTQAKRQREQAKRDKRIEKDARRALRKSASERAAAEPDGSDAETPAEADVAESS